MFKLERGDVTVLFDPVGTASVMVTIKDRWGISGERMLEEDARERWRALRRRGYRRIL